MSDVDALTPEDLLREYSPSSVAPEYSTIVQAYRTRSDEVRKLLSFQFFSYGSRPDEIVALSGPFGSDRAIHIFIHGGYWQELSWEDSLAPAEDFHNAGFIYGAVNYTLAPEKSVADMVAQCVAAVAAVVKASVVAGGPGRITISGSSAGGHLAAMMDIADWSKAGLKQSPIDAAILLSGVYDLTPLVKTAINGPLQLTEASAAAVSPMLLAKTMRCRTLVVWGENETAAFKRQSIAFVNRLVDLGCAARAQEIANRNHFDIVFDLAAPGTQLGRMVIPFVSEKE